MSLLMLASINNDLFITNETDLDYSSMSQHYDQHTDMYSVSLIMVFPLLYITYNVNSSFTLCLFLYVILYVS